MRTSYSALDTYKTCPLKFKFQNLDKVRVPKNIEMIFGSVVHSALKYMFERVPLYPTIDEVVNFFRNKWDDKMQVFQGEGVEEKKKIYYEEGISILKNFYKKNQAWNFNVVDMESRFEIELEDKKNKEKHVLTGIIDRIDKNPNEDLYEIIDYKTSKKMPAQNIIDHDLQMSIYHMSLIKRWPHLSPDKIKLSLYYLKHGEKISTFRSGEQMENKKNDVISTIREVQDRISNNYNFPPTPSPLCGWCGYKQMCPMWKHLYQSQISSVKSQKDIEPIIQKYFELKNENQKNKERIDELKTIINGFMEDQKIQRVFGQEGYITRTVRESVSYDMEKIREILEPAGKWNEILSPDEKKLEKLLSSLPDGIRQKIRALSTVKNFSTLTSSKRKIEK